MAKVPWREAALWLMLIASAGLACALAQRWLLLPAGALLLAAVQSRTHALQRALRDADAALNMVHLPFFVVDAQLHVQRGNSGFLNLLGLPPAAHPALPQAWREVLQRQCPRALQGEDLPAEEVWLERTGQPPLLVALRARRLGKTGGRPELLVVCEDRSQHERFCREQLETVSRTQSFVQSLIDVIPQPVYVRDAESRFLLVNAAFTRDYAPHGKDLVGTALDESVADPAAASQIMQEDQEVLAGRVIFKEVASQLHAGRHLIVAKGCCLDPHGRRVVVGTHFDITAWRQAEAQLHSALAREVEHRERVREYVQRLINVIPQPVYVKDAQSRYLLVNEAFCTERRSPREALVGHDAARMSPYQELAETIRDEDRRALAGETIRKEECLPHMYTGEERFRLITKGACLDAEGQPVIVGANFDVTPWRQAERQVKDALANQSRLRKFLQLVFDVFPTPVLVKDAELRYVMANRAAFEQLGLPADCIGHRLRDYVEVSTAQAEAIETAERKLLTKPDGSMEQGTFVLPRAPNQDTPTSFITHKVVGRDADDQRVIVVSLTDVTPIRRAEANLQAALEREIQHHRQTQEFVQRLIDVIPYPVYVKNAASQILLVNDAFAEERRIDKEDLPGRSSVTLQSSGAEIMRSTAAEDARVLAGEVIFKEEHKPSPVTGADRYRVVSKASCEDANGQQIIVVSTFDVTRWRLAERELAAALQRETERSARIREYVQRLIDVIPQPVYVKDANSHYLMVNQAFAAERGLSKAELVGRSSTITPEMQSLVFAEDAEVLAGHTVLKEEFRPHPVTGQPRYRVIAKGRCLDDEGHPVIVGANFDVTPWRLAETRLFLAKETAERANAAKTLFLTNMSHELRTPMHGILSFARIGLQRAPESPPERLRGYFERIVNSAERLMALLDDLLDLAKLEAGRMEVRLRSVDVTAAAQDALNEFEALAHASRLDLCLVSPAPQPVQCDPKLLGQVLRNLLSNAIKFSPPGSEILLSLQPGILTPIGEDTAEAAPPPAPEAAVELIVADRGPGIPEDELESVFDKFVQSSKTRSGAGGTGLGLAICREIARAHGGQIFARNRAGGGAEFVLRLPVGGPPPTRPEPPAAT